MKKVSISSYLVLGPAHVSLSTNRVLCLEQLLSDKLSKVLINMFNVSAIDDAIDFQQHK